ncbi:MAG: hypothetical protein JO040_00875 [Gemmatimonadetes bacterium]|nr:hypothetical protein [Gemmatimonadota bacterium]
MNPPLRVRRGADELRRLLDAHTHDVRALDVSGFRDWLARRLERWEHDPAFAQRARIRDLRRAHPRLRALEARERDARAADEASPGFARLRAVDRELTDIGKAVAGLVAALEGAAEERRPLLTAKLAAFRARREALRGEREALVAASDTRRELERATAELDAFRAEIGVDREEARLRELLAERGRSSGRGGAAFEDAAVAAVLEHLVPELASGGAGEGADPGVRVLRGVTLGAARTEIDQLVVRASPDPGEPVEVLALVEAKRNPDDLGHGFRRRQENLAWLTGSRDGYDPAAYRTRSFPRGHFDRPAVHVQDGERHTLARESFCRFARDPATGFFLDRLYLVTRPGTLWGVGAAAMSRIAHRVATDERWEPESDAYLRDLLRWCLALADPLEAPDVLRLYGSSPERARQLLLLE